MKSLIYTLSDMKSLVYTLCDMKSVMHSRITIKGFKGVVCVLVVVVVGGSFSSCVAFIWKGLCVDKLYSLGFVSFVLCPEVIVCVCGWDG